MKKIAIKSMLGAGLLCAAAASQAMPFVVDAYANSSSGGTGASTVSLLAGQSFSVSVAPNDLWNAGALPRWSNADGLTGNLFATGSDDSGQSAGTQIGQNFGPHRNHGVLAGERPELVAARPHDQPAHSPNRRKKHEYAPV